MMHSYLQRPKLAAVLLSIAVVLRCNASVATTISAATPTQPAPADERAPASSVLDDPAVQRLLRTIRRQPRPGAAFDRLLQLLQTSADREAFAQTLRSQLQSSADTDGSTATILGLLELEAGRHSAALANFTAAEQARPSDPVIPWLLATAALQTGDVATAVAACERSLALKPAATDLPGIARDLTSALRKAGQSQRIPEIWDRIESADPDNLRLCEQAASALRQAGLPEPALARYQRLATSLNDPWRQTQARLAAADLKRQLGRTEEALADDEALLSQLDPEDWQARQLLDRIEDSLLQANRAPELLDRLRQQVQRAGPSSDLLLRITRLLRRQNRSAEVLELLQQQSAAAPANRSIRLLLIDELARLGRTREADAQYRLLEQSRLLRPEDRQAWGYLLLTSDNDKATAAERAREAAQIWRGMLLPSDADAPNPTVASAKPDPAEIRRVADLFCTAGLSSEAIPLYQQALELAPADALTRERLGSCLHSLGRRDEALTVWRVLAAGDRRSPEACRELASILQSHGEHRAAITALQDACNVLPNVPDLLRLASAMLEYREGSARPLSEDSLHVFDQAAAAAESPTERRQVFEQRAAALQLLGRVDSSRLAIQKQLSSSVADNSQSHSSRLQLRLQLVLLERAAGNPDTAFSEARAALSEHPNDTTALQLAAESAAAAGLPGEALALGEQLLAQDPRGRTTHLQSLMVLARQQGLSDKAARYAESLLQTAGDDPTLLTTAAEVLAETGQSEAATAALEAALRRQPDSATAALALASLLADLGRIERAVEICQAALQQTPNDRSRTELARLLAELQLQRGNPPELLEWIETQADKADELQRSGWFRTLAEIQRAAGQFSAARRALERSLELDGPDPDTLLNISELSLLLDDPTAAVTALQQIKLDNIETPAAQRLLDLTIRAGPAGAALLPVAATQPRLSTAHQIGLLDRLMQRQQFATAADVARRLLAAKQDTWEIRIRSAAALSRARQPAAALAEFTQLLQVSRPLDTTSADSVTSRPGRRRLILPTGLKATSPEAWETAWEQSVRILLDLSSRGDPADFSEGWCEDFGTARLLAIAGIQLLEPNQPLVSTALPAWDAWVRKQLWSAAHGLPAWSFADAQRLAEQTPFAAGPAFLGTATLLFAPEGSTPFTDAAGRWLGIRWRGVTEHRAQRIRPLSIEQLQSLLAAYSDAAGSGSLEICENSAAALVAAAAHTGQTAAATQLAQQLLHTQASSGELLAALFLLQAQATLSDQSTVLYLPLAERLIILDRALAQSASSQQRQRALQLVRGWMRNLSPAAVEDWQQIGGWWLQLQSNGVTSEQSASQATDFIPRCWQLLAELLPPGELSVLQDLVQQAPPAALQLPSENPRRIAILQAATALQSGNLTVLLEAVEQLSAVVPGTEFPAAAFLAADCQQRAGRFEQALTALRELPEGLPRHSRRRAMRILELGCLLPNAAIAEQAARELSRMELSAAEYDLLLSRLRTVGLVSLLAELQQRQAVSTGLQGTSAGQLPGSGLSPAAALEQLQLLQQAGNTSAALQLAEQVVTADTGFGQSGARFRRRQDNTAAQLRNEAWGLLRETGQLQPLIERQSERVRNSPQSTELRRQLADSLQAAGRTAEAADIRSGVPLPLPMPTAGTPSVQPNQGTASSASALPATTADKSPVPLIAVPGALGSDAAFQQLRLWQQAGETNWLGSDWPECGPIPVCVIQRRLRESVAALASGEPERTVQLLLAIEEQDAVRAAAIAAATAPDAAPVSLSALRQRAAAELDARAIQRAVATMLQHPSTGPNPLLPWNSAATWFAPPSRDPAVTPGLPFLRNIAASAGRGNADLQQLRHDWQQLLLQAPDDLLLSAAAAVVLIRRSTPEDSSTIATQLFQQLQTASQLPPQRQPIPPDQLQRICHEIALLLESRQLSPPATKFRELTR